MRRRDFFAAAIGAVFAPASEATLPRAKWQTVGDAVVRTAHMAEAAPAAMQIATLQCDTSEFRSALSKAVNEMERCVAAHNADIREGFTPDDWRGFTRAA